MDTFQHLQHSIALLPPEARQRLATWLRTLIDEDKAADRVAEPTTAYDILAGQPHLSVEDYLKSEADGRLRHEYVAGEIFAMSGASVEHNIIAGNVFKALSNHLQGGPCRTFVSDFKVRLKNNMDDIFYYPDVMVACGNQGVEKYFLRHPKLIVEVLSPSTETTDRREKLIQYRRIASLEEYVLIAQSEVEITIHRRSDNWTPTVLTSLESTAQLRSVELSLPLTDCYRGLGDLSGKA